MTDLKTFEEQRIGSNGRTPAAGRWCPLSTSSKKRWKLSLSSQNVENVAVRLRSAVEMFAVCFCSISERCLV